jgi:hypothetical protein
LQALAERAAGGVGRPAIAEVGDAGRLLSGDSAPQWRRLDASESQLVSSETPAMPGLYELTQSGERREVALLVPAAESQTQPLSLDTRQQLGDPQRTTTGPSTMRTAGPSQPAANAAALESRQQLWRWILWVAVALLALESVASYAVSRRRATSPGPVAQT